MKKDGQALTVRCFFAERGEKLPELLARSFRIFLERNLQNQAEI